MLRWLLLALLAAAALTGGAGETWAAPPVETHETVPTGSEGPVVEAESEAAGAEAPSLGSADTSHTRSESDRTPDEPRGVPTTPPPER